MLNICRVPTIKHAPILVGTFSRFSNQFAIIILIMNNAVYERLNAYE